MTSELDAIIEDLGKLRRYLSREKYIDETVYEVYPKDLAAELATRWAAFIKRGTDSKVKLDPVAVAQVAKSFRALREFADRQVMRSRYDREIKAILKATERWQISPKGTVTPPLQPIASPPLPAKPAGVTRRVFISMPSDEGLSDVQNKIKWGIVRKIADAGYEPQIFTGPSGGVGLPAGKAWTFTEVDAVMDSLGVIDKITGCASDNGKLLPLLRRLHSHGLKIRCKHILGHRAASGESTRSYLNDQVDKLAGKVTGKY